MSLLDSSIFTQEGWKIPEGTYTIQLANLTAQISVAGEKVSIPVWQAGSWYKNCKGKPSLQAWETMMGKPYAPPVLKKGSFTMDNTVMEMKDYSLIMKIMFGAVESTIAKGFDGKKDYDNPQFRMLINSSAGGPLRGMQINGGVKGGGFRGLLEMANGHFLKGVWKTYHGGAFAK